MDERDQTLLRPDSLRTLSIAVVELVINAAKHGGREAVGASIDVSLACTASHLVCSVCNSAARAPPAPGPHSKGMELLAELVRLAGGQINWVFGDTTVTVTVQLPLAA